jgi:carbon-monoxide dehydrogenase small subunit
VKIKFELNGEPREVEASAWRRLIDVLRIDLGLTGTKEGCGEGECGACTVLIDGAPANSCLIAAGQVDGHAVVSVEGLADGDILSDVQKQLVDGGGVQCGSCTPGIALSATYALEREPDASRERLRELLAGNLCRCTGYQLVIDAVEEVAAQRREGSEK